VDPLVDQPFVLNVTGVDIGTEAGGRGAKLIEIVTGLVAEDLGFAADTDPTTVSMHVRVVAAQYVATMFVAGSSADPTSSVKAEQIDDYRVEYAVPGGGPSINLAALHDDLVTANSAGASKSYSVSTLGERPARGCGLAEVGPSWL
jgi:hypothetical protein